MPAHHRPRLARSLAGALVVVAVSAPAAPARPIDETFTTTAPTPTVIHVIDDGFDWHSAAVGAGGAAAAMLAATAGVSAASRRRRRSVSAPDHTPLEYRISAP